MPMKGWHTSLGGCIPSIEIRIVEQIDELEQNLSIKRLRSSAIDDGRNDGIPINA